MPLTPFICNLEKWLNMLQKPWILSSAICLKHVWPYFNIIHTRVSKFCTNVSRLLFSIFRLSAKLVNIIDKQIFVSALLRQNYLSKAFLRVIQKWCLRKIFYSWIPSPLLHFVTNNSNPLLPSNRPKSDKVFSEKPSANIMYVYYYVIISQYIDFNWFALHGMNYKLDVVSTLKLKNSFWKDTIYLTETEMTFLKKVSWKSTYRYFANILRRVLQCCWREFLKSLGEVMKKYWDMISNKYRWCSVKLLNYAQQKY